MLKSFARPFVRKLLISGAVAFLTIGSMTASSTTSFAGEMKYNVPISDADAKRILASSEHYVRQKCTSDNPSSECQSTASAAVYLSIQLKDYPKAYKYAMAYLFSDNDGCGTYAWEVKRLKHYNILNGNLIYYILDLRVKGKDDPAVFLDSFLCHEFVDYRQYVSPDPTIPSTTDEYIQYAERQYGSKFANEMRRFVDTIAIPYKSTQRELIKKYDFGTKYYSGILELAKNATEQTEARKFGKIYVRFIKYRVTTSRKHLETHEKAK